MSEVTLVELKARAYDLIAQREAIDRALQQVNQEIFKLSQKEALSINNTEDKATSKTLVDSQFGRNE